MAQIHVTGTVDVGGFLYVGQAQCSCGWVGHRWPSGSLGIGPCVRLRCWREARAHKAIVKAGRA